MRGIMGEESEGACSLREGKTWRNKHDSADVSVV